MNSKFKKIKNQPNNYPIKSDIVFWSKERNGTAGHCAIVVKADEHSLTVIEQNYDGKGSCRKHTYNNYNNVLGWLRRTENVKTTHLKNKGLFFGLFRSNGETVIKRILINCDYITLHITGTYNNMWQLHFDNDNNDYYFYPL